METYSFTYRDHKVTDRFVRGWKTVATSFINAIALFEFEHNNCEILAVAKQKAL